MMITQSVNSARVERQSGFSLVELMVALVLGLLVVGAILQLFLGSRSTQMSNEALARVQENGRFSVEILKREFRDVGTHGFCAARVNINNHLNSCGAADINAIFDPTRPFTGWEYASTGRGEGYTLASVEPEAGNRGDWRADDGGAIQLPAFLDGEVVPGSDVIIVRRPEVIAGVAPDGIYAQSESPIGLNASHGMNAGTVALITNCSNGADLFQTTATGASIAAGAGSCGSPGPGNQNINWSADYSQASQLFRVNTLAYYIGYNAEREEPGLYRAILTEGMSSIQTEELVEGIETMQILYGYSLPADQGGDGQTVDFWLPADEVPNWELVIGARLSMLMRSPNNMADGPQQATFDLASTQFTHPEDARLRQPFFAAISLRNRQLVF